MDTELARTFLMVATSGNFVAAASRLHVTQSTVSARIQTLETTLGTRLFQRGRNGATLTVAGKRFLRHAKNLVRTVEQARHDIGLPEGYRDIVVLSARIALWEEFLPRWVAWMRDHTPDVSLRLEVGFEQDIMESLIEGRVDIGVMYTPTSRPGLVAEILFEEDLLLVTSDLARGWPDPGYIHIDWEPEFHALFSAHFPDVSTPTLVANIGWLGVQQLLTFGGSGYFPYRLVHRHIESGHLWQVPQTPRFKLPVWMVYPREHDSATLTQALEGLRRLGRAEQANAG